VSPSQSTTARKNRVFKLADVSGPIESFDQRACLCRHPGDGLVFFRSESFDEIPRQFRDVLAPLPERRHMDREDVQPVVENPRETDLRAYAPRGRDWSPK